MLKNLALLVICNLMHLSLVFAQNSKIDYFERNLKNPPPEAKVRTWWHLINGNVSSEGIKADLEAMKAVDVFWQGGISPIINKLDTIVGSGQCFGC